MTNTYVNMTGTEFGEVTKRSILCTSTEQAEKVRNHFSTVREGVTYSNLRLSATPRKGSHVQSAEELGLFVY